MASEETRGTLETGRQLARVNAFSDGLFSIAATLLVLSIDVPRVTPDDLNSSLHTMLGPVEAYFISFAVVAMFWFRHHQMFGRLRGSTPGFAALNLVFLSVVALLPVPTQLLGRYDGQVAPVVIYACFILALSVLLRALFARAARDGLLEDGIGPGAARRGRSVIVVFALSIPLAFVDPTVAKYSWVLVAIIPRVLARRERGEATQAA